MGTEFFLLSGREACLIALLIGVSHGLSSCRFEGFQPGRMHQICFAQGLGSPDVHDTPFTVGLAGCEAHGVRILRYAPADAVDPSETKRLIDGLRVGDTRFS